MRESGGERVIQVRVKRFRCRSCGKVCNADEPFYPDTRIGAPVIDLCIAFSSGAGYGRAARSLSAMGIAVDRMQCRHFALSPVRQVPSVDLYGFPVPRSILSLSMLTSAAGGEGPVSEADLLEPWRFLFARRETCHGSVPGRT